jgi:hypothetical protein
LTIVLARAYAPPVQWQRRYYHDPARANTGENVIFAREKLKGLSIEEILLIGKISSKRRYVMTVRKQWPEIRKICCLGVSYFSCGENQ